MTSSNLAPSLLQESKRFTVTTLREKRGDTRVDTIEKKDNVDLGMRGNAHLDTALKHHNVDSLHELIEKLK